MYRALLRKEKLQAKLKQFHLSTPWNYNEEITDDWSERSWKATTNPNENIRIGLKAGKGTKLDDQA